MLWWSIRTVFFLGIAVVGASYYFKERWPDITPAAFEQTAAVASTETPLEFSGNELAIAVSSDGHFYVDVMLEGTEVQFLVDTGASGIVLSRDAAESIGLDLESLNYTYRTQTANGSGRAAPITLTDLRLEEIVMEDVRAIVNDAQMPFSLLGMSFLSRLESYEVRNGYLILRR